MADGDEPRPRCPIAMTERARSYFNNNLPSLAANSQQAMHLSTSTGSPLKNVAFTANVASTKPDVMSTRTVVSEEQSAPTSTSKRAIKLTEKGAQELASRVAQREQYEKSEQRSKRKAEAEARGNASQPAPIAPEPKRQKISLKRPEDILDIPYARLLTDEGCIKLVRQALIQRNGSDPYGPGIGLAELEEIYNEEPGVNKEVQPNKTDFTIGKTVVKKSSNRMAALQATDHTTIGIGGAPNYTELPRGVDGKPIGVIELDEPVQRSKPRPTSASTREAKSSSPASPHLSQQTPKTKSHTKAASTRETLPRSVSRLDAPGSHNASELPSRDFDQRHSVTSLAGSVPSPSAGSWKSTAVVHRAESSGQATPQKANLQAPTPQSKPRRRSGTSSEPQREQDLDEDEGDAMELDVAGEEETGVAATPKRETKQSEAQLHWFGAAKPLVAKMCERIRVRFATVSPFADMTVVNDNEDSDSDSASPDCPSTLLDNWITKEWPCVNQMARPNQPILLLEDRFRRYIRAQFCRWRNEVKTLIAPEIKSEYPFVRDIKCQQNIDLVRRLDPDRFHSPNLKRDKLRFQHPLIGYGIKKMYYSSNGLGFRYKNSFKNMPSALILLFCCIIRHCILEYETGEHDSDKHLNSQELFEYWKMYKTVLDDMGKPGHEPNRLRNYRKRLFVRCHGPVTKEKEKVLIVPTPVVWETDSEPEEEDGVGYSQEPKPNKGKQRAQVSSPPAPSQPAYEDSDED